MQNKLQDNAYATPRQVLSDVKLIWANCHRVNGPNSELTVLSLNVSKFFMRNWLRGKIELLVGQENQPARQPPPPTQPLVAEQEKPTNEAIDAKTPELPDWAKVMLSVVEKAMASPRGEHFREPVRHKVENHSLRCLLVSDLCMRLHALSCLGTWPEEL